MTDQIPSCPWSDRDAVRVASLLSLWVHATRRCDTDRQAELRSQLATEGVRVTFCETPTSD
jgi:hypothetical protein